MSEEKQVLIEYIKSVIDEYEQFGGGDMDEQVYRIALASMIANPVAYTDKEQLTELSKNTFAEMYSPDDSFKDDPEWVPLYTEAPSLRKIKVKPVVLPRLRNLSGDPVIDYANEQWNCAISACKKAIRAAGYKVKE